MRRMVFLVAALCVACNSSTPPAPTGVPSTIILTITIVGGPPPPTASIIATMHDAGGQPVTNIPVAFSTTSGFITSGGFTNQSGEVQAFLTGTAPGTSATVTATETVIEPAVSASTVVRF
jgi:hypothetical protein